MSYKGGYKIIDLQGKNLNTTTQIQGLFNEISATDKAILLTNGLIDNKWINEEFVNVKITDKVNLYYNDYKISIDIEDNIEVTSTKIDIDYISNLMNEDIFKDTPDTKLKLLSKQIIYVFKKFKLLLINLYCEKESGIIINSETEASSGESQLQIIPIYKSPNDITSGGYIIAGDQAQCCWLYMSYIINQKKLTVKLSDTRNIDSGFRWEYNEETDILSKLSGFGTLDEVWYEFIKLGGMMSNVNIQNVEVE